MRATPAASPGCRSRRICRRRPRRDPCVRPRHRALPGLDLGRLLPGLGTELETEDVLLLLILYLLYRESGDRELLIVMGAMFLL